MSIAPHEASAKGGGGMFSRALFVSRAEAATVTPSRPEATTETLGGCGGKRYRDRRSVAMSALCRGPAARGAAVTMELPRILQVDLS